MTLGTDSLRRDNTGLLLRTLRRLGPSTRAELAQVTGLAKATVGAIVGPLVETGVVTETSLEEVGAARTGARGRPGRPVALTPATHLGLGLELNVDYVSAVLVDLAGGVVGTRTRVAGAPGGTAAEDALLALVAEVVADLPAGAHLLGATLAVPALVREDDRTIAWAPNLPVLGDTIAARLEQLLPGCPVRVSNDANCAAYAESRHGAAVGVDHALYLTGTVGIGAGIIDAGVVVQGAAGFAGEVGHMPVGDPRARCGCGRLGCWEASIGLRALLDDLAMPDLDTPLATAAAVAARAATDPDVRLVLDRVGRDLGLGLATLCSVLDPQVVVLGGYFVPLGELVLAPAREVLDARLPSQVQVRPELRPGSLGIEAAALGAAEQSLADALAGSLDLSGPGVSAREA